MPCIVMALTSKYNPINSQIHSSIWNVLILTNPKELGLRGLPIKVREGNISGNDVIITVYR